MKGVARIYNRERHPIKFLQNITKFEYDCHILSFLSACRYGLNDVVQYYLQNGAHIDESSILAAVGGGNVSVFRCLMKRKYMYCDRVLIVAAMNGSLPMVRYVHSIWPQSDIHAAVRSATCGGHLHIVRYFIENGADVNMDNSGLLRHAAVCSPSSGIFHYLLEQEADIKTALAYASSYEMMAIRKLVPNRKTLLSSKLASLF